MGMIQVFMPPQPLPPFGDVLVVTFSSIAIYNGLETYFWIFHVFKEPRGLYFWSMQTATLGILMHTIFQLTSTYDRMAPMPSSVITVLGYYLMTVSPLFVLYSRLHIISLNFRKIRWIFYFIVGISSVLFVPAITITVGAVYGVPGFIKALPIYLGIQITAFTVTEIVLSGIFVWTSFQSLQPIIAVKGKQGRNFLKSMVVIYIMVVILLLSLLVFLVFEYLHFYFISITFNPFVCSLKLKLEFTIITLLQQFMHSSPQGWTDLMPLETSHKSFSSSGHRSTMKQRSPSDTSDSNAYPPDFEIGRGHGNGFDQYAIEQERAYQQAALRGSVVQLPSPPKIRSWEDMYLGPERI